MSQIILITVFTVLLITDSGWYVSQFLEQKSDLKNQQSGNQQSLFERETPFTHYKP